MNKIYLIVTIFIFNIHDLYSQNPLTDSLKLKTGFYFIKSEYNDYANGISKPELIKYIDSVCVISSKDFKKLKLKKGFGGVYNLNITFTSDGRKAWSIITQNINKSIAFVLNNEVLVAPRIREQINSGIVDLYLIDKTQKECKMILKRLK